MPPAPSSPKVNWMKGPAAEIKNTKVNATFCFTRHLSGSKSKLLKVHCFKRQGGHRLDISTILLHRGWDLVHPFHGYCDGIWWQSDGMDDDDGWWTMTSARLNLLHPFHSMSPRMKYSESMTKQRQLMVLCSIILSKNVYYFGFGALYETYREYLEISNI